MTVPGYWHGVPGSCPARRAPKQLRERSWAFRHLSLGKWVCCPHGCWQDRPEGGAHVTPGEQWGGVA